MAGSWWSVWAHAPTSKSMSASSWHDIMASALCWIEEHDFSGEGMPEQLWVKQQKANEKTARRKANRTKKKKEPALGKKRKRTDSEELTDNPPIFEGKSWKICIFPSAQQKEMIKRWMGTT